jgi:UDP-glucuronate 4-epimerase
LLEGCRHHGIEHLVYASSSSVYGANTQAAVRGGRQRRPSGQPVRGHQEGQRADGAHLQPPVRLPTTGLRFFTVYGPWGRPDMALFLFTRKILAGEPIDVFNHGNHTRDFTYVDDIVEGRDPHAGPVPGPTPPTTQLQPDPGHQQAPYRVYNIGNHQPVQLSRYIEVLEDCLGKKAEKNLLPLRRPIAEQPRATCPTPASCWRSPVAIVIRATLSI